jgi:hypothetical protein
MDNAIRNRLASLLAAPLLAAGCAGGPSAAAFGSRSDDLFARIPLGTTMEEVRRIAGPPDDTMAFPMSHTTAWDYRYQDAWGYLAIFSVTFSADGHAVGRISNRINSGGDHP